MDATRAPAERHPGYPWLMCGSLGLSALGLYYLLGEYVGWRWDLADAAALWVAITFGLPGLGGLWDALWLFVAAWNAGAEPVFAPPEPPEPATGRVSPLVGGGLLDAWEQYHHDGILLYLDHAEAAGALTSTALIPAAFADSKHWGYWAGVLAASQLCVKSNGVATTLPAGRTWAWAKRQVRNGLFETPEDLGAAPPALPHPLRDGLAYNLKLEKAGIGGLKLDEDD